MYSHRRVAGLGAHTRLLPHQRKIIMERADKVAATLPPIAPAPDEEAGGDAEAPPPDKAKKKKGKK